VTINRQTRLVCLFVSSTITFALCCGASSLAADNAATLYSQRCASCHGEKGHGDGVAAKYLTPPPADFATSLKGKTDDWIAKAIKGGGPAVGESPTMPPYADLSAAQIKGLVDYIKHFNR
jgi:mono/diheme cytochrome c family protein